MGKVGEGGWEVRASGYGISHRNKGHRVGNTVSDAVILYGDRYACGERREKLYI